MKLAFEASGWDDYRSLRDDDPKAHKKLDALIAECLRHPFTGTGKPEALRQNLKGYWSRRVSKEHRLVYRVMGIGEDQTLLIVQCWFHY
jgi:toxin YoeB